MSNKKVLIVDDALSIVKILEVKFKNKGWNVKTANDGQQALEVLKDFTPDIIFLDIMMPKMDGYQLSEKLKNNSIFKDIPLILVTGVGQYEEQLKGLDSGVDEYITKPFDPEDVYKIAVDFTDDKKKDELLEIKSKKEARLRTIIDIMHREKN